GVRALQSDGMCRPFAVFQCPGELIGRAGIVTETEQIGGSCPTSVFPLSFGREPVGVVRGQSSRLLFALCYGRTIGHGLEVTQPLDWTICVALEVAGVLPH